MRITPEQMRLAYELLAECPPFDKWNLPHSEDIKFAVSRRPKEYGEYHTGLRKIMLSSINVSTMEMLLVVMAHEMIHVHEQANGVCSPKESTLHTEAFQIYKSQVCKSLGFNPDTF